MKTRLPKGTKVKIVMPFYKTKYGFICGYSRDETCYWVNTGSRQCFHRKFCVPEPEKYKIPQSLYPPIETVRDGKLVSEIVIGGTQRSVAAKLGVHHMTICKREIGAQVITKEAELALLSLKTL